MDQPIQQFPTTMPLEERIRDVAPVLNWLISGFYDGSIRVGVEAFQDDLMNRIEAARCIETCWVDPAKAGVHPSNREEAGLLPVDVQDLLLIICRNGWVWNKCDLLATRIPNTEIGKAWRRFNKQLAEGSDGLLAKVQPDALDIVTARGSHTTAAVRCVKVAGTRGLHAELCGPDGCISRSIICEMQPSMKQPLEEKGLPYKLINADLVAACPDLMKALSRTGNASHGVHRIETTLQGCKRMHELIMQAKPGQDRSDMVKLACLGQLPGYNDKAECYYDFVNAWSGGKDAHILLALEAYERTLQVKRNILPTDLRKLAAINLVDAPKYVPAMFKAMLNAPSEMVNNGFAEVWTGGDLMSISISGKNREHAVEASRLMEAGATFLKAYNQKMTDVQVRMELAKFEINCVMHVHGKKSPTRKEHMTLMHVAKEFYQSCKAIDPNLPVWKELADLKKQDVSVGKKDGVREIRDDGEIPNSELIRMGFVEGALLAKSEQKSEQKNEKDNLTKTVFRMSAVVGETGVVEITEVESDGKEAVDMLIRLSRRELIMDYVLQKTIPEEARVFSCCAQSFLNE